MKDGILFKNGLHGQISMAYPSYNKYFSVIDGKCAMYFWKAYPTPVLNSVYQVSVFGKPTSSDMPGDFEKSAFGSEKSWWVYYNFMNGESR